MINWQETFLFPVRDSEARRQYLIACLISLVGFIIPILPNLILLGYCAQIMRQVVSERKPPTMPDWRAGNWSQFLIDGAAMFGVQMILVSPLLLFMCGGMALIFMGSMGFSLTAEQQSEAGALVLFLVMAAGLSLTIIFSLLSFPYGIIISAALPHSIAKNSFASAFAVKEWFPIFRKGLGQFILGYLFLMVASYLFIFVVQFAMLTLILMCIVPFIMIPYSAYFSLVSYAVYAQAYTSGLTQMETHNATS